MNTETKTPRRGLIQLRDYQQHAVDMTLDLWGQGLRSVLFVCPTGGGKTFVFSELARLNKGRTLILADRKRLIDQAAHRAQEAGLTVGFEQAERRTGKRLPNVVCATIQSISQPARLRRFKRDAFSLVVVDEADLGITPTYRTVLDYFSGARVFGCTATPDRADGLSLGSVFEDITATVDMHDLIEQEHLSGLEVIRIVIESVSLEGVSSQRGDFTVTALTKILNEEKALHEVVVPTMREAGDRPTLVFAATVAHAQNLAAMFNRYRPGCARAIDGDMGDGERKEILDTFQRREFQFLCNCVLMIRGVDLPLISCVAMARPTLSRGLYAQSIGRGTRRDKGKKNLLVIDFVDNSDRHDLMSVIDVLLPGPLAEARPKSGGGSEPGPRRPTVEDLIRERAREIMVTEPGCDPLEVIERARREVAEDQALRERVRAKVEYRLREILGIDWDAQPLGKMPDTKLAQMLTCSTTAVQEQRARRGIPPFSDGEPINWDAQPLGQKSDMELARQLGVSNSTVTNARKKRGIQPFNRTDWDTQPLGKETDADIAKRLGVSIQGVHSARKERGIPVYRRTIDWDAQPLGKVHDSKIAKSLRVHTRQVRAQRSARGIPALLGHRCKGIDWSAQPLGQMPDGDLARQLGITRTSVKSARIKRNIPPYQPTSSMGDRGRMG